MEHVIQSTLARLRAAEWIPVTAARVLTGVFFCISGGAKLLVPSRFSEMQETLIQSRIPFPYASALFVSLVEFACGGGLVLGLLTPLCAAMLMGDMIVAILTNRLGSIHASGFLAWLDDFLYLPEVLYVLILFWLLFSGPGPYSVDSMMARWGASPAASDR
jgi:putative oxidoreductase